MERIHINTTHLQAISGLFRCDAAPVMVALLVTTVWWSKRCYGVFLAPLPVTTVTLQCRLAYCGIVWRHWRHLQMLDPCDAAWRRAGSAIAIHRVTVVVPFWRPFADRRGAATHDGGDATSVPCDAT